MNRIPVVLFTLSTLLFTSLPGAPSLFGQKEITLADIYRDGTFRSGGLRGVTSMKDGSHYTVNSGTTIDRYSFRTGEMVETLFDGGLYDPIDRITGYTLGAGERMILLETSRERIYRHSYRAVYYVFDREQEELHPVAPGTAVRLGTLSPDGTRVAFVKDNDLYIRNLKEKTTTQVTSDGEKNRIINGAPDWVYEEEFGFSQGFYWSPDSRRIAFYRFDESRVKQFHMTLYGPLYPELTRFKYPKAGEENSLVTVHVYDLEEGTTLPVDVGTETDQYIPRIQWTTDPEILSIMRLNRLQNQLDILHASAVTGESEVVYHEENRRYISEASDETITYLSDGEQFVLISEREGYFHLYLYNFKTGSMRPITSGPFDIHSLLGVDENRETLYYTSYEESTTERHLYSIRLNGTRKKKLSSEAGSHSAAFSHTFDYYLHTWSSANHPPRVTLHERKGKEIRVVIDNRRLREKMDEYGFSPTEFFTVPTENGLELNAWMIKPADFDPMKEYPLFVYVYGGPESQNVVDSWGRRTPWFQMLVQQGYIVACVDNRGTNGRGEEFRKSTYMQLGRLETIDQLEAARWFGNLEYIDSDRMGIFGWSYGGYMTSLCMTKGKGMFKMGIAGAPVTNWRYYDTIYTERFMRTPRENPEGYDQNSPIHFAGGLQGKFLLIHGSADDNVHFQNSMDFITALVEADKQFEMQVYPNKAHGIRGGNSAYHLYKRMTDFILENL